MRIYTAVHFVFYLGAAVHIYKFSGVDIHSAKKLGGGVVDSNADVDRLPQPRPKSNQELNRRHRACPALLFLALKRNYRRGISSI